MTPEVRGPEGAAEMMSESPRRETSTRAPSSVERDRQGRGSVVRRSAFVSEFR